MGVEKALQLLGPYITDVTLPQDLPQGARLVLDMSVLIHALLSRHCVQIMLHDDYDGFAQDVNTCLRRWQNAARVEPAGLETRTERGAKGSSRRDK